METRVRNKEKYLIIKMNHPAGLHIVLVSNLKLVSPLKYCRYGVKLYPINQSIKLVFFNNLLVPFHIAISNIN